MSSIAGRFLFFTVAISGLALPAIGEAAEPQPPEGFRAIFNGRDLAGWHGLNPHNAQKLSGDAKKANLAQQRTDFSKDWTVASGELVNDGHGPYATTDEEFGDIELLIEYKTVPSADSGIYLRGTPQVQIWDWNQVFDPKRPTRKPHLGSGGLFNNTPGAAGRDPLVLADRPFGEWNQFHIRQIGDCTWVWLNDKLVVDGAAMENFWDRNQPLPAKGPIMLQTHGGEIRWRNIFVREIGAQEAKRTLTAAEAVVVKRNIPYADPAHERQVLDVYAPSGAKNLPVVFWIHGGGWQTGDKTSVQLKPQAFVDKGFVFVSTNYRLLPDVDIETIFRDIAKSVHWVHDHIAEHGGDPKRLLVMGHSAGAQLAALICIDDRYLKAEGLSLDIIKGCVPVDGDTYDVPAIIETAETRRRVHGQPQAKFGHREKFGNDPAKHRDYSAVTHVAKDKGIPPFLILHVAEHPDTSAQAQRLASVLKEAGVPVTVFGGKETTHNKINADLGLPDDPATKALFEFVGEALKK
jgi:arylformamidase